MTWYGYYWDSNNKLETIAENGGNAPDGQTRVSFGESKPNMKDKMWDESTHDLIDRSGGLAQEDVIQSFIGDSRFNIFPPLYITLIATVAADFFEEGCRYK